MKTYLRKAGLCLMAVLSSFELSAQGQAADQVQSLGEFAKSLNTSRPKYAPLPSDAFSHRRGELQAALEALDAFLLGGGEENRNNWHNYLLTTDLRRQLASEKPDVSVLNSVLTQYRANQFGLELEQFIRVRTALLAFIDATVLFQDAQLEATYTKTMDELAKRLSAYDAKPNLEDAVVIGRSVGFLRGARQAESVARDVEQRFSRSNLFARVSQRLMAAGIEDDVNDVSPINENILGTQINGTANTTGRVSLQLLPDSHRASLLLCMRAITHSQNVGYNGPVTICSHGESQVCAEKRLYFTETGFTSEPAAASVTTDTTIDGIGARSRLIERIAWKKAGKTKGQAEAIASSRAEVRVSSRMDEQASGMLAQTNGRFQEKFRTPLVRRGIYPNQLRFSTTNDALNVEAMHASTAQLAAPSAPPSLAGKDLVVQVHESMIANYGESILGGVTLTDEKLEKLVEEQTGNVPEELKVTPEKDPWSITFASELPVSATFGNNEFTLAIRTKKFTRGEQELRTPTKIAGTYTWKKTDQGAKLTRQGDVDVSFIGHTGTLSVSQVAFKTFIRRKFDAMMKPEIESQGLKLPGRWENAGRLRMQQVISKNGWLAIDWALQPPPATNVAVAARPIAPRDGVVVLAPAFAGGE